MSLPPQSSLQINLPAEGVSGHADVLLFGVKVASLPTEREAALVATLIAMSFSRRARSWEFRDPD